MHAKRRFVNKRFITLITFVEFFVRLWMKCNFEMCDIISIFPFLCACVCGTKLNEWCKHTCIRICRIKLALCLTTTPQIVHFNAFSWFAWCCCNASADVSLMPHNKHRYNASAIISESTVSDSSDLFVGSSVGLSSSWTFRACDRSCTWFSNTFWQMPHFLAVWYRNRCRCREFCKIMVESN